MIWPAKFTNVNSEMHKSSLMKTFNPTVILLTIFQIFYVNTLCNTTSEVGNFTQNMLNTACTVYLVGIYIHNLADCTTGGNVTTLHEKQAARHSTNMHCHIFLQSETQ